MLQSDSVLCLQLWLGALASRFVLGPGEPHTGATHPFTGRLRNCKGCNTIQRTSHSYCHCCCSSCSSKYCTLVIRPKHPPTPAQPACQHQPTSRSATQYPRRQHAATHAACKGPCSCSRSCSGGPQEEKDNPASRLCQGPGRAQPCRAHCFRQPYTSKHASCKCNPLCISQCTSCCTAATVQPSPGDSVNSTAITASCISCASCLDNS